MGYFFQKYDLANATWEWWNITIPSGKKVTDVIISPIDNSVDWQGLLVVGHVTSGYDHAQLTSKNFDYRTAVSTDDSSVLSKHGLNCVINDGKLTLITYITKANADLRVTIWYE
jgi:hypothetical protein